MQFAPDYADPLSYLMRHRPDEPVLFFSPKALQATARAFQAGFPGLVTYAVKANPDRAVLENLVAAGITSFDVASPAEMCLVRDICPDATLHYNNPVRSRDEIRIARDLGVASYSVDSLCELDKLGQATPGQEVSVRLKLNVPGAAYDFGAKFGTDPDSAVILLHAVAQRGFVPSICFHPGTQCTDPAAWTAYIRAAAQVAQAAGIGLGRLNVGGGFPALRASDDTPLSAFFDQITTTVDAAFGADAPQLICEPGRAMVADCMTLGARIKALRRDGAVFLNDGIYGALSEARDLVSAPRLIVIAPDGTPRCAPPTDHIVFGPTCDSLDRLPGHVALPRDMAEGDFVLCPGQGAYSSAIATRFNGYGPGAPITVDRV